MLANADLSGRIKFRLFRSYFDFSLNGFFTQGRSGIGWIRQVNSKFRQAKGLGRRAAISANFVPALEIDVRHVMVDCGAIPVGDFQAVDRLSGTRRCALQ